MTLAGRGQSLSGGQRSSAEVFGCFSPSGQALLAETALGLMAAVVSVRQAWLQQHHPTVSIPITVTHTMGGFARDVARRFSLGWQTYSHIAHMEALLRADRFFGVSLFLLQQTEASFLAAFILAGGVATIFELFSHEWLRNPVRVAAAQEARRLAGIAGGRASAAASAAQGSSLGVFSSETGRPDGLGMNLSGRYQKVQEDAADLKISAANLVQADAWRRSVRANEAVALVSRGMFNPNCGVAARNAGALRLGEAIGSAVMGQENWAQYITTSAKNMLTNDKPFTSNNTKKVSMSRSTGEREGRVFHHADVSVPRWAMTDMITYRLPDHTEEYPKLHMETLQAAISESYHAKWERHSRMANKNKKDVDAGKPLYRGLNPKP